MVVVLVGWLVGWLVDWLWCCVVVIVVLVVHGCDILYTLWTRHVPALRRFKF